MGTPDQRVEALRLLIELDQAKIDKFHSFGCPHTMADEAKEAFDRIQRYRQQVERIAYEIRPV